MDGSPVVFQRWDQNQPRFLNNDENCAVMTNTMGEQLKFDQFSMAYFHGIN